MSLLGVSAKPLLPTITPGGTYLTAISGLDKNVQAGITAAYNDLRSQVLDLRRSIDIAYTDLVSNAAGFASINGIGGSTQAAQNFSRVGMAVSGSTQFTWSFGATEADTNYGIVIGLNGPNTLPTVMKAFNQVQLNFGAVTPAGLKADLLLFR